MDYKIIVDSCGDFDEEMKKDETFSRAILNIHIDDLTVADDESFDQKDFLEKVKNSPNCPKSSCPSPEDYLKVYKEDVDRVYAVTLSSKLSGSYNSAKLAENILKEENPDKKIHVFDSKSASVGETIIALKIKEFEDKGYSFSQVVEKVENFIKGMNTYFILESLETLRKNGRLSNLKAFAAEILNIKPIMSATKKGEICQRGQARGMKKGLEKMVNLMLEEVIDYKDRILGIAHCNCKERAEYVKELVLSKVEFKRIMIVDTGGISSLYAGDGGIILVS